MGRIKEQDIADRDAQRRCTTLGDLRQSGVDIFCWCNRCGHNATVSVERLCGEIGPAVPVPEVGARMRCSGCGGKDIATRPDWPSLGQVTRHD